LAGTLSDSRRPWAGSTPNFETLVDG